MMADELNFVGFFRELRHGTPSWTAGRPVASRSDIC